MNTKKILLARPNTFIVNEMTKFINELDYIPVPIKNSSELNNYSSDEIGGIVISTAISSTVNEGYDEMLKLVNEKYASVPVVLVSLIALDKFEKAIQLKLNKVGLSYRLHSVSNAMLSTRLESKSDIVVIENDDLVNQSKYPTSRKVAQKFFL